MTEGGGGMGDPLLLVQKYLDKKLRQQLQIDGERYTIFAEI